MFVIVHKPSGLFVGWNDRFGEYDLTDRLVRAQLLESPPSNRKTLSDHNNWSKEYLSSSLLASDFEVVEFEIKEKNRKPLY